MRMRAHISGLLILLLVGMPQFVDAQNTTSGGDPSRSFPPLGISMSGLYQNRTYENTEIYEVSSGVDARVQLMPNLLATLSVNQATVEHDSLQRITGLADIQVGVSYIVRLPTSRVIASLSGNLPAGKTFLSRWAYDASFPMGLSHYDFSVPFFSHGSSVSPSVGWVFTASPDIAVGVGVSYSIRGSYEPHRQLPGRYAWGNELTLSANAEWSVSSTFAVSGGFSLTSYGADTINDVTVYTAGSRIVLQLGLFKDFGRNDFWFNASYRNVGTNQILYSNELQDEPVKAAAGSAQASVHYRVRFNRFVNATFGANARRFIDTFEIRNFRTSGLIRFDQILALDQLDVFGVSVNPEFSFTPSITIPVRLEYLTGDMDGFNAGIGFNLIL